MTSFRVPAVVQWDRWHLVSVGTQVLSQAQHSGLRIQCLSCGVGQDFGSDLIRGPGAPDAAGWPKERGKITSFNFCDKQGPLVYHALTLR